MNTSPAVGDLGRILDGFRADLRLQARLQLRANHAGKVDLSGVVQQTLLDACQARDGFPSGAAQQAAWLRRALANNLIDAIRRVVSRGHERVDEQSLEQGLEASPARLEARLACDAPTPGRAAIHKEQLARLAEALLELPEDQRAAVELHHLQDLSLTEVGRRLGRSREAVAGLVFRGLTTLRSRLADKEGRGP